MGEHRDENLLQTLVSLEEQGWQALSQGTGADFYRRNLAGHALMVFPFGVLAREQSIETMKAAPPWASFRIEDPRLVRLTDDSAILTYRATAQRTGQEPYSALMTTVFVKQEGTWKTAFHQQTPVSA
jgi:hypothetical protein